MHKEKINNIQEPGGTCWNLWSAFNEGLHQIDQSIYYYCVFWEYRKYTPMYSVL